MTRSRLLLPVLLGVPGLALAVALVRVGDQPDRAGFPEARPVAGAPAELPAAEVLRGWDVQRAAAYEQGSTRMLRDLYVAGSAAGTSDVRLLRSYRARGIRVVGMRMQVLALRVPETRPDRLRLVVTDRLDGAVAVGGGRRAPLPRDLPDTRTVTLLRGADGAWRVSAVTPVR